MPWLPFDSRDPTPAQRPPTALTDLVSQAAWLYGLSIMKLLVIGAHGRTGRTREGGKGSLCREARSFRLKSELILGSGRVHHLNR
jgi:hypothetical protein